MPLAQTLRKHRKPLLSVLALALLGVAMFVSVIIGPRESFDQKTWLEAGTIESEFRCTRGHMVRHLREHVLRTGMTRAQIEALLGKPDAVREFDLSYGLGFCASAVEPALLVVHLDGDGKFSHSTLLGM